MTQRDERAQNEGDGVVGDAATVRDVEVTQRREPETDGVQPDVGHLDGSRHVEVLQQRQFDGDLDQSDVTDAALGHVQTSQAAAVRRDGVRRLPEVAHRTSGHVEAHEVGAEGGELRDAHLPQRNDVEEVALPLNAQVRQVDAVVGQVRHPVRVALQAETAADVEPLHAALVQAQHPSNPLARHEPRSGDAKTRDGGEQRRQVVETVVGDEHAARHVDAAQRRAH